MPTISFLRPVDQPSGKQRLLDDLRSCLASPYYTTFRFATAFAKSGPLRRLLPSLKEWKADGKAIEAIFGIDHLGTSLQALKIALDTFDRVFITHLDNSGTPEYVTFHPKLYLFYGEQDAICFYGSHNLTVGGTETNYEGGIKIEFKRPADEVLFQDALDCWQSLLPGNGGSTRILDDQLLQELLDKNLLLDEEKVSSLRTHNANRNDTLTNSSTKSLFPYTAVKPPSALPQRSSSNSRRKTKNSVTPASQTTPSVFQGSRVFVIQIVPHDNGEVHLSKIAVNQNPSFFDFPFIGWTTPKKASNPPYPQRTPDPVVNIKVYDSSGQLIREKDEYGMNTVYYKDNGEIRVTLSPDVIRGAPPFSIMVMTKNATKPPDYDISIFFPNSQQYNDYLNVCNQTLPSGGPKYQPRKMGWI